MPRWAHHPDAHRKEHGTAPAILFDDVPGYPKGFRTLYGHFSTIKRVALTLGLPLEHERKVDIVQRYHDAHAEHEHHPPRYVKTGRSAERAEGDDVDVLRFPVRATTSATPRATSAPPTA